MNDNRKRLLPPTDGTCTLPDALEFQRQHNPDQTIYVFSANSQSPESTKISFDEFAYACEQVAHLLKHGRSAVVSDERVVGVLLVTDTLQYQATLIGIMKAGLIPFPISHRLTPEAIAHLLRTTLVHDLIVTSATLPQSFLTKISDEPNMSGQDWDLKIQEMPNLQTTFPKLTVEGPSHIVSESFDQNTPVSHQSPEDIAIYMHTSGSSGLPKAIAHTYKALCQWAVVGEEEIRSVDYPIQICSAGLPPFHAGGFHYVSIFAIYHATPICLLPPVDTAAGVQPLPPSPSVVLEHVKRTNTTAIVTAPTLVQEWARSEEDVKFLSSLKFVGFGGGVLPTRIGDSLVTAGVNLQSIYGSTECGAMIKFRLQRGREELWEWIEIADNLKAEWISHGDETYECYIPSSFDGKRFATSDLFIKHPTEDHLWKIVGRVDDVIIHSSGEKTLPQAIEDIVTSSSLAQGAVVFGRGYDHAGLLVEIRPEFTDGLPDGHVSKDLIDQLWPLVEEANKATPHYSRIKFKEMILIAMPDKPLPRSAKGTVIRQSALQKYSDEIEQLYNDVTSSSLSGSSDVTPPETWDANCVETWLSAQVATMNQGVSLDPAKDLFEQGCDSLTVTFLHSRILSSLKMVLPSAIDNVPRNIVYEYPTIKQLAEYISRMAANPTQPKVREHYEDMEAMIAKYSVGLGSTVFLTGSTGRLGAHILAYLLENPIVCRVYTFNRRSTRRNVLERHAEQFEANGLESSLLGSDKIRFIEGDLSMVDFGISKDLYDEIHRSVDLILHVSWEVNFNLSLVSFEPHIKGVRNLIDFARLSPHASSVRFILASSIASFQSWDSNLGPYPEAVVQESKYAVGTGYGESKYVAERILERSGLNACSIRIGQLSGTTRSGAWSTTEWFPILVKSSIAMGALPSVPGLVSWIPVDLAARSVLDMAFTEDSLPRAVNLVHPRPVPWNEIVINVQRVLSDNIGHSNDNIQTIPGRQWLELLNKKAGDSNDKHDDVEITPALKLLDFFRDMFHSKLPQRDGAELSGAPVPETSKAKGLSGTLREIQPVGDSDAKRWVEYWRSQEFFV